MSIQPLSRRSAMRGAGIAAVAAVAGFVVARAGRASTTGAATAANAYGPAAAPAGEEMLARVDGIAPGAGLVLADARIVLTRDDAGAVHAFSAICTHQGCPVSAVTDGAIICPCHASRFDASTGAVLSGPATRPLPPVAVVERDGAVYAS